MVVRCGAVALSVGSASHRGMLGAPMAMPLLAGGFPCYFSWPPPPLPTPSEVGVGGRGPPLIGLIPPYLGARLLGG